MKLFKTSKEMQKIFKKAKEAEKALANYKKNNFLKTTPTLKNTDCNNPTEKHLSSSSNYKQLFEKYKK